MENGFGNHGSNHISVKVLVYHRIVEDDLRRKSHWANVSVDQLRKHLKLLDLWGFTPITFNDYLLSSSGELQLPKRPVIITFESGYRDTYKFAFPLLKEFGMNAVVFAIGDRTIRADDWNKRLGLSPEQLVLDDELTTMHEAGFEIGSQSLTHPDLTSLPDQEAWNEVTISKEVLEFLLGSPITSFSYPFGLVDERIKDIVKNARYRFGCGKEGRSPGVAPSPFSIKRISITNTTNAMRFAAKLLTHNGHYEWPAAEPLKILHGTVPAETTRFKHLQRTEGKSYETFELYQQTDGTNRFPAVGKSPDQQHTKNS